uniref:Uncharacterized protein n=1 Tax=Rhizophora mucronata TaxID=61149 RepID=A0A2P2M6M7_RHIMU
MLTSLFFFFFSLYPSKMKHLGLCPPLSLSLSQM